VYAWVLCGGDDERDERDEGSLEGRLPGVDIIQTAALNKEGLAVARGAK
jgi:hypothetical protein